MKKPALICWLFAMICLLPVSLLAGTATVQWQASQEPDLNKYKVHFGTASRSYGPPVPVGKATSYTFSDLQEGITYYFSVTAVDESGNESGFSSEVSKHVPDTQPPVVMISSPASVASYQSPGPSITLSGSASDNLGVTEVLWSVTGGGGGTASGTAAWSIQGINLSAGQNEITVRARDAAGNLGAATVTVAYVPSAAPAIVPLEAGEAWVNHNWRRIGFKKVYIDPIVIAASLSRNGKQPSVVRVRNVNPSGFEIRVQEWDYLDSKHAFESVGYLIVERGVYTLSDGTRLEAGSFNTDNTGTFKAFQFNQSFSSVPVLIPSISSFNGRDAVTCRLRNISAEGFESMLQEEEASAQVHTIETVSYVAWEPSSGSLGEVAFEVARTGKDVRGNKFTAISFSQTYQDPVVFLAAIQSTDGGDTAALRWAKKSTFGVQVVVEEEKSGDTETGHKTEVVGYMVLSTGTPVVANR